MSEWLQEALRKPKVLLDTNLLVVYLMGLVDPDLIRDFKVTAAYRVEDFELLQEIIWNKKLVISSAIFAETSNLGGKLYGERLRLFRMMMRKIVETSDDMGLPVLEIVEQKIFLDVGHTDSEIFLLANQLPADLIVLTAEWRLAGLLKKEGVDCVNFNHLRTFE